MHPPLTYELKVIPEGDPKTQARIKARLVDWLLDNGVESFVEGQLDCDVNHDYQDPQRDFYGELGGDAAAISIYRYGIESLEDLQAKIGQEFGSTVRTEVTSMETSVWMEGWKESFKPFSTRRFHVRPPWEPEDRASKLIDLVVEPGMAFGTGQHATTRLCIEALEDLTDTLGNRTKTMRVLDVGTGTGILAVAVLKLGFGEVHGTDIEDDAVRATQENARLNGVSFTATRESVPRQGGPWNLVIANILTVVLERIMPDLARAVAPGGHLLLSGLLVEEQEHLRSLAEREGLRQVAARTLSGWAALLLERPAG